MGITPSPERSIPARTPLTVLPSRLGGMVGLPVPLTDLVGRELELALGRELLGRPDLRLLTFTGPGGIGKTRLAIQLAADLVDAFADGVCFVPLESVRDANLVAASIAHAVDVQLTGNVSALDALSSALHAMDILLVVDNCEQVLAAMSLLTALLANCPRLKILATSRVLLRVAGEHALAVPPLTVADPRSSPSLENLVQSSAIQLFADRAQSVAVSFVLTESSARQVAEICRRVDGLPLAIELIAPRVRHLALPELLDRLSQRLPLLTGGSRDQPSRLQTMRNAIAWSYDLLSPELQGIFRCVAVFTGGFSLEAAEHVGRDVLDEVGADNQIQAPLVFDGMTELIDASLLQTEIRSDGMSRFRMLETIREYALEQLGASNETAATQRAHAAYYLTLAERYELADLLPDGNQVIALLEADHANFRAALTWLTETGQRDCFLRLAAALGRFWSGQGHYQEGRAWLTNALTHTSDPAMADRAKALVCLGMIGIFQGSNQEAEASLTEGLAGCLDQGHMLLAANALIGLGALASIWGDLDGGERFLTEALSVANAVEDRRLAGLMAGWALINLAAAARSQDNPALAAERLEEALGLERQARYTRGTILALGDLGDLARDGGDHRRAWGFYQEALSLVQGNAGTREVTDVIEATAIVAVAFGHLERGARLLGATESARERTGLRLRFSENQVALEQAVSSARAALGQAAFSAAWAAGRALQSSQAVAEALQPIEDAAEALQPIPPADAFGGTLTKREREILILMAYGLTDPAIAAKLFLSVRTVENHVAHVLAKVGVRTRTAAASAAIAAGLVPAGSPPPV